MIDYNSLTGIQLPQHRAVISITGLKFHTAYRNNTYRIAVQSHRSLLLTLAQHNLHIACIASVCVSQQTNQKQLDGHSQDITSGDK